jgi:hypothetical protein
VTVYSPSWINVGIKEIKLKIEAYDIDGKLIPNFEGNGLVDNLRFPSRATTEFVFPLAIQYNTSLSSFSNDPALIMLRDKCLSNPQKPIRGKVTIQVDVSALSWLGIRPKASQDRDIKCPGENQLGPLSS